MASNCKDCNAPIKFVNMRGKWVPTDPETGARHRCDLDQTCSDCGGTFKGSPWMTQCRPCWEKENLDKNRVHRGRSPEPEPAPGPETLTEDWDDGKVPF